MSRGKDPANWVGEDEMVLADLEGHDSARADAAFGRDKRRSIGLERRGQLERIREVFGSGDPDGVDDVRLRVLYHVIGYVHEQKWREAVDEVRRWLLSDARQEHREWREAHLNMERVHATPLNWDALFLPDRHAIAAMTHQRRAAIDIASDYLTGQGSGLIPEEETTYPNPYQDLWIVDPVDPKHRGEHRAGGNLVVVPTIGPAYAAGTSSEPLTAETVGMIGPPDLEWDFD
ncbi:hypothetical protein [Knoellia sinensis]|nr:hypothetical protein [Knoellia sinensis]